MKLCGVSNRMSSPFQLNANLRLVENLNMGEYQSSWDGQPLALGLRVANTIARSREPEMHPNVDAKKRIKEKVREKRRREGKSEDFPVEEKQARIPPPVLLKEEDPEKVRIRRERNKIAATKCRQRRRERIKVLKKQIEELQSIEKKMTEEISTLKRKKATLKSACSNHLCVLEPQPTPQTQSRASASCTYTMFYQGPPFC